MTTTITLIAVGLLTLTAIPTLYYLLFALAARMSCSKTYNPSQFPKSRYAVLIPGYKEDEVILETAKEAINQNYPAELFDVFIIADSFQQHTLQQLAMLPVRVLQVNFEKSTKTKALQSVVPYLPEGKYNSVVILDADNIMERDFLSKVSPYIAKGHRVIQAHRTAKNKDNTLSMLDAISEEINNTLFRMGHNALGLSAALIGSGIVMDVDLYKRSIMKAKAIGGFDKELELMLLKEGVRFQYVNSAYVYDEKVSDPQVFEGQRKRWLSAQFFYFKKHWKSGINSLLFDYNIDYFNKVIQMALPPRSLLLVASTLLTLLLLVLPISWEIKQIALINFGALFFTLIISTPLSYFGKGLFSAIIAFPARALQMFSILFKTKGANSKFIHTRHGSNSQISPAK